MILIKIAIHGVGFMVESEPEMITGQ